MHLVICDVTETNILLTKLVKKKAMQQPKFFPYKRNIEISFVLKEHEVTTWNEPKVC